MILKQWIGFMLLCISLTTLKAQVGSVFLGYSTLELEVDDQRVNIVPGSIKKSTSIPGYSAGWLYNQVIRHKSVNFETGLIFSKMGGEWSYRLPDEQAYIQNISIHQIQVPVNFRFNLFHADGVGKSGGLPIYLLGGFRGGVSILGEETITQNSSTKTEKINFGNGPSQYRIYDIGVRGGVALKLHSRWSIEAIVYRGLQDFINLDEKSAFNKSLEFRLRFHFGGMDGERRYFFHQFFRLDSFW
ncbi:PorT family protein [Bacteroidia bacterium]|nr:PorT family protein [Bacteroidia bacterium]